MDDEYSYGHRFYRKRRELQGYTAATIVILIIAIAALVGVTVVSLSLNDFIQTYATEYHTIEAYNPESAKCDPDTGLVDDALELPITPIDGSAKVDDYGCYSYLLFDKPVTGNDLNVVEGFVSIIAFFGIIVSAFLVFFGIKHIRDSTKMRKDFKEWSYQFLEQTYFMAVATTYQEKKENGENIFEIVGKVFPQLRKKDESKLEWAGTIKTENDYEFDVLQVAENVLDSSDEQIFIGKHFGDSKVTIEKIQEACDEAKNCIKKDELVKERIKESKNDSIMRMVIVAKNFEFNTEDEDELNETMEQIDFMSSIDLISEDEDGNYILEYFED